MDKKSIGDRILLTLRLYDKVDPEKVGRRSLHLVVQTDTWHFL